VGIAALCIAACGTSNTGQSAVSSAALARVHAAVDRIEAAGTVHFEITSVQSQKTLPGQPAMATATSQFTGDEQFDGHRTNVTSVTHGADQTTSSVSVYVNGRRFDRFGSSDPTWTEYPTRQTYPFLGITQLAGLKGTDGPVAIVGRALIDGQPTTEYRISLPASTTTGTTKPGSAGQEAIAIHFAPSVLLAWIDSEGRVARTASTVTFKSSAVVQPTTVHTVANLSEFGAPVHIKAPTAFVVAPSMPK
jgi:hypothetical protein